MKHPSRLQPGAALLHQAISTIGLSRSGLGLVWIVGVEGNVCTMMIAASTHRTEKQTQRTPSHRNARFSTTTRRSHSPTPQNAHPGGPCCVVERAAAPTHPRQMWASRLFLRPLPQLAEKPPRTHESKGVSIRTVICGAARSSAHERRDRMRRALPRFAASGPMAGRIG